MRKVLGFGVAGVVTFALTGALLTPRSVTASLPENSQPEIVGEMRVVSPVPSAAEEEDDTAATDLLGNPISDAVAKYKFDATGSLYELHSPQTELPRLASPKS